MFRSRFSALMAAALFALAPAACGSDDNSPSGPSPAPQTGTIAIRNDSDAPIDMVNFTSCEDASWGANRLASGETIAPGATRSWTTEAGCYDVRARIGSLVGTWWDRDLTAGGAINLALDVAVSNVGPVELNRGPAKVR